MGKGGGRVAPQAKAWPHQNYFPGAGAGVNYTQINNSMLRMRGTWILQVKASKCAS